MTENFYVQRLLSDVFHERDLLDLESPPDTLPSSAQPSQTGRSTPPPPHLTNRLSSFVSGTAAAASRRARGGAGGKSAATGRRESPSGSPDRGGNSGDKGKIRVRCSAGYANNLYIGSSDGQVLWYTMEPSTSESTTYALRAKHTLFPRRPIDKIYLCPLPSKLLILAEGTLHFLSLPTMDVCVPAIQPIRGVIGVALDDQEMGLRREDGGVGGGAGTSQAMAMEGHANDVNLCVLKRDQITLYRIGVKLYHMKDIPVPLVNTPKLAVRSGLTLCMADPTLYDVLDLQHNHLTALVPILQLNDPESNPHGLEAIMAVIPGEEVFLVCTHSEGQSMGIFVDGNGDAIKGTVQWEGHVKALVIEADSIVALLRDGSIVIHSLAAVGTNDESPRQIITLQHSPPPKSLQSNAYGTLVPNHLRDEKFAPTLIQVLRLTAIALSSPLDDLTVAETNPEEPDSIYAPPSGSGFSPPTSPAIAARTSSLMGGTTNSFQITSNQAASSTISLELPPATTTIAEIVVIDDEGLLAVTPIPWVIRGDTMIEEGRLHDCVRLLEEERKKAKKGDIDGDRGIHSLDLRFLYIRLAYCYLSDAMFEEAGSYFTRAKIDPRLVIRLFPKLVGNSIQKDDMVSIWKGYHEDVNQVMDVDDIIERKISQIYGSDRETHELAETQELTNQLMEHASAMLLDFLRKSRTSRRKSQRGKAPMEKIDIAVDTCLAKLLARRGEDDELLTLLRDPNACLEGELESFVDENKQAWLLSRLMLRQNRVGRFVEILANIADGITPDPRCARPQVEVFEALQQSKDPPLIRKYGLWLVKRDMNAGLMIFISQDAKTGVKFDDRALIADLSEISKEASNKYLEHVVVYRRSVDKSLHDAYVGVLLDECEALVLDDGVLYHFKDLYEDYLATRPLIPYCQYLAETAFDSPAKTTRLKTILFLQGSPFYDLTLAESRLEKIEILFYELAIVLGRLGRHEKALRLLALRLGDSVSAETYCTQGGEVLPQKIARAMVRNIKSLEPWAVLGEIGRRRKQTIGGEEREILVMELLKVYMSEGEGAARQTAALLNAQALHLDATQVLDMIPNDWALNTSSDFVCRSLKREMHSRATWQVLKAISAGQNLQTTESFFMESALHPPVIQARPPNDDNISLAPPSTPPPYNTSTRLTPDEGSIAGLNEIGSMFGEKEKGQTSPLATAVGQKEEKEGNLSRIETIRGGDRDRHDEGDKAVFRSEPLEMDEEIDRLV